ncbi:hypothetical protein ACHAQJ_000450 [Trichoderma viride]
MNQEETEKHEAKNKCEMENIYKAMEILKMDNIHKAMDKQKAGNNLRNQMIATREQIGAWNYCSQECKQSNSEIHSYFCPPNRHPPSKSMPTKEIPDHPVFDTGVFWANYAATDILNLAENEGAEYNGPLRILLTGTFGLRHLIYSVAAMPETASPSLDVTISEMELPHLYRTFISLLILWMGEGIGMNPFDIADLVINVWYSYKWPPTVRNFLDNELGGLFSDLFDRVSKNFANKPSSDTSSFGLMWGSQDPLLLDICLDRLHWNEMLSYIKGPVCNGDPEELRRIDVMRYGEPLDRAFARMSPSRVAAMMRWREEGVILSYGDSSSPLTDLNPMFFPANRHPPGGITNEPLSEWPMSGILYHTPHAAREDVYGKMLVYVRDMLVQFQLRSKKSQIHINLMATGTMHMAGYISRHFDERPEFDRVEAGHLFDIYPELCLLSCSLLLRHEDENPFATLLTMTRESVILPESTNIAKLVAAEKRYIYQPTFEPWDALVPPVRVTGNKYSAACLSRHFALLLLHRNWDLFSDRYLNDASVFGFKILKDGDNSERFKRSERSVLQTGYLGLRLKPKNKITVRWPNRLVYGKSSNPTAGEVMRWMSWSTTKPERWLEWKRVDDVSYSEWSKYLATIEGEEVARDWEEEHYGIVKPQGAFIQAMEAYEACECEDEDYMDIDGAEDENIGPSMAMEDEDDGWMMVDAAESDTTKKSKKKKKKKKRDKK